MERLEDWILLEQIGVGGVADVWRARHDVTGQEVALKVLREPEKSQAHRDRFLREGRLLRRLDMPGLPSCTSVGSGAQPFLALELLEGETLAESVRSQGRLPPPEVERVAAALLHTLMALHARGIIHRDIKASNVFLTDDGRVLLLDLGLAADPGDPLTTTLGDVMGTYAYMAPEQIAGAEVDQRCDLYSLGITLYEAAAGVRPFYASDAAGYLRAHWEGHAAPLSSHAPDLPSRILDTISRLMARDPSARPGSVGIALALLNGSSGGQRQLDRPPLVGRAAAMGAVQAVLDSGGAVMILGEIGSGVSRIISYTLQLARDEHFETLAVRCSRRGAPLEPLAQLSRGLEQILNQRVEPDPAALGEALRDLSEEGALLLLVEDAELCSPEAAAGLVQILARAPKMATVLTGTEAPAALHLHTIHLRPLSQEEIGRLLSGMLGTATAPVGLAEQLYRMSGGLAGIVVMTVRELVARGSLWFEAVSDEGEPTWRLDHSAPLAPTTGLARLFGDLLVSLPDPAHAILEVLTVAGEALPLPMALEVAEVDPSGIDLGLLNQLALITVDRQPEGDWIELRRPAVGALLLAQVPQQRQIEVHRALASAIRSLPRGEWRDEHLLWHEAHSAPRSRAAEALLRLGEQLHAQGAHARALQVFDRAAELDINGPVVAANLAIARGEALMSVGRKTEAQVALQVGLEQARELHRLRWEGGLVARALVGLAELAQGQGAEGKSLENAREAIAVLAERPDDPSLPRALLAAATAHWAGASPDEAAALFHQCIDVAMAQGQREFAAMAHGGLGLLMAEAGRLEGAARHLEQEAAFLRTRTLPGRLVVTLYRLSVIFLRLGLADHALDTLAEAEGVAQAAELPYLLALARVGVAAVHQEAGDRRTAARLLRKARAALERDAAPFLRLTYRQVQAELRMMEGDHQAALAAYQAAEQEATRSGFTSIGAYALGMTGVLTADVEALTRAMEVLGRSGDRSLTAKLLMHGARIGGDADVLHSAEMEARSSHDRFTLLAVLHAAGTTEAREEGLGIAAAIEAHLPPKLVASFRGLPMVRWTGLGVEALSGPDPIAPPGGAR